MPSESASNGNRKKLYALLIGVETYENFRPLAGCLNDITTMEAYLKGLPEYDLKLKVLRSDAAGAEDKPTKKAMVHALENHYQDATSDDVMLFYFAGHGVRERTTVPAFLEEDTDAHLETLVCYDSQSKDANGNVITTLADKELRYLLKKAAEGKDAHFVVIMDCCHSGGNTRGAGESGEDAAKKGQLTSRLARPGALGPRSYKDFCFAKELPESIFAQHKPGLLNEVLPITPHIQLAACSDVEEAWEDWRADGSEGGYFSITMMKILERNRGGISYYDLINRASNRMRDTRFKPQTPQLFNSTRNPNDVYRTFLAGTPNERPAYANVSYNPGGEGDAGWMIDLGALHGIPVNVEKSPTPVTVKGDGGKEYKAKVSQVMPGHSMIEFEAEKPERGDYEGYVKGRASQPLQVAISGESSKLAEAQAYFQKEKKSSTFLELKTDEDDADYVLRIDAENTIRITLPDDDRPLVKSLHWMKESDLKQAHDYLFHISQWEFMRKLHNPDTQLHKQLENDVPSYPVELRLYQLDADGKEVERNFKGGQVILETDRTDDRGSMAEIRMTLKNHSEQDLYVCLVYLSGTFGAYSTALLNPGVRRLGPEDEPLSSVGLGESAYLKLRLDRHIKDYNWEFGRERIKLLVSTEDFKPEILQLNALPAPEPPKKGSTRGLETNTTPPPEPKTDPPKTDWTAILYELHIRNLEFVRPS